MVSVTLLAAIGTPIVIMLIVLLILVIGSRNAISEIKKDLKYLGIEETKDKLENMEKNVNINSQAVDLLIPWVTAAQETFQLQGFGAY